MMMMMMMMMMMISTYYTANVHTVIRRAGREQRNRNLWCA
jgi:hypothetical protein